MTFRKLWLLPLLGLMAGCAMQPPPPATPMPAAEAPAGPGAHRHGAWLEHVKADLAIAPAQEPAWAEYVQTLRATHEEMRARHREMREAMATMTEAQRHAAWRRHRPEMRKAFETVHAAAMKLMAALTPEQKKIANDRLPGARAHPRWNHDRK